MLEFINDKNKVKSVILTALIAIMALLVIFNFGMPFMDPPEEYGVVISLGNTEIGGNSYSEKISKEENTEKPVEQTSKETKKEELLTSENEESQAIIKEKTERKKEINKVEEVKTIEKPKPSKSILDALSSLNNAEDQTGKGDNGEQGKRGIKYGVEKSKNYLGSSGSSEGGNYRLSGRSVESKKIINPNCNEEGTVVVKITVNNNGKVTSAIPGERGTTNTAKCLIDAARKSALATVWNTTNDNTSKSQTGFIIYHFSVTE